MTEGNWDTPNLDPKGYGLGAASILMHIEGATIGPDEAVRSCGYDPVMRP